MTGVSQILSQIEQGDPQAAEQVFEAADGDLLVGNVAWTVDAGDDLRTTSIRFSWRDSVAFSDETVVSNTGRFVEDRPPGLVVIAIIAILAAILFPVFA